MAATTSIAYAELISATSVDVRYNINCTCSCLLDFSALWDKSNSRCTREPSCELWTEEMLLEERERHRDQAAQRVGQVEHERVQFGIEYEEEDEEEEEEVHFNRNPLELFDDTNNSDDNKDSDDDGPEYDVWPANSLRWMRTPSEYFFAYIFSMLTI